MATSAIGQAARDASRPKCLCDSDGEAPSLSRELFDLSVFFSVSAETPDQIVLAEDEILPVCSPKIADGLDLETVRLLHDQTWQEDWPMWSEATRVSVGDPQRGPRYSLYALAVEEAKSDAGVLMGNSCLVEQVLQSRQLNKVSSESIRTGPVLALELSHRSRRHLAIDEVVSLLREEGRHSGR